MAKPKITESGAQIAGAGAVGTIITAALDAANVAGVAFEQQGWLGIAAIAIGLTYRAAVKWLEQRGGGEADDDAISRIESLGNSIWAAVSERGGGEADQVVARLLPELRATRGLDDKLDRIDEVMRGLYASVTTPPEVHTLHVTEEADNAAALHPLAAQAAPTAEAAQNAHQQADSADSAPPPPPNPPAAQNAPTAPTEADGGKLAELEQAMSEMQVQLEQARQAQQPS